MRPRERGRLVSVEKRTLQILALLLLGSLGFQSWSISLGVILGGAIALLNFRWLWQIMERIFFAGRKIYGIQILVKFLALLLAIFLIVRFVKVHPVAFLVGLSSLVLGIFWEVFRESLGTYGKRAS